MSKKVRFGVVGLGGRGYGVLKATLVSFSEIEVVAVCDLYQDRVDRAADLVEAKYEGKRPLGFTDYHQLLALEEVDAVYVACSWEYHVAVSIDAMKQGKAVCMEVGGAYSIDELNDLVRTQETTGAKFMMMENCCFNKDELLATNLARHGVFGEIIHCQGAYSHDLRDEIAGGNINRHYRLRNYTYRNCDNYPTHELGPIAKILNINRGNRFVSVVSVASKACGMKDYIKKHHELVEKDPTLAGREFKQGDIVHTIITCQNGETILLKLDTTLPRSYSREFTVRGTDGFFAMDNYSVYRDGEPEGWDPVAFTVDCANSAKKYEEDYLHPIWLNITEEELNAGHGGMDGFEFRYFLDAYFNGKEMPVDVYDAAAWMVITTLSEQSIAAGGAPIPVPDFTNGKWLLRQPLDVVDFSECKVK